MIPSLQSYRYFISNIYRRNSFHRYHTGICLTTKTGLYIRVVDLNIRIEFGSGSMILALFESGFKVDINLEKDSFEKVFFTTRK